MRFPLLFAALFLTLPTLVLAQHKHVHGEGRLDVAIDKDILSLDLELPLDAAVGFEHPPRSEKEQAALAEAQRVLDAVPFVPASAAACALQSKEAAVPFRDGKPQAADAHADVDARYVFRCANPAALNSVETTLFKSFKRLYRLETQRAGPQGQGAARLSPNQPALRW